MPIPGYCKNKLLFKSSKLFLAFKTKFGLENKLKQWFVKKDELIE